jgi:hypothetical protein
LVGFVFEGRYPLDKAGKKIIAMDVRLQRGIEKPVALLGGTTSALPASPPWKEHGAFEDFTTNDG